MRKTFLFILVLFLSLGIISAGTEDVPFEFKLEYIQADPLVTCVSEFDNSTNQTWNNCSTISNGQIKITGGDNTYIGVLENLLDIIPTRIYNGVKTADLGNLSDITGINDKLEYFTTCNDKLNACMDSNRNVSSHLILLQEDSGLKANFTECSTGLIRANSDLDTKKAELKLKDDRIKSLEGNRFMWVIFGGIIGAVAIGVVVPRIKGTSTPKSSVGRDHPPNPGY